MLIQKDLPSPTNNKIEIILAKILVTVSGIATCAVLILSKNIFWGLFILAVVSGPLILIVGVLFIILGIAIVSGPFLAAFQFFRKAKYIFSITSSVVSIIFLIFVGVYAIQFNDKTVNNNVVESKKENTILSSNFKLYSNPKYGIEFTYPENFIVSDGSDDTASNDVVLFISNPNKEFPTMHVLINYDWVRYGTEQILRSVYQGELLSLKSDIMGGNRVTSGYYEYASGRYNEDDIKIEMGPILHFALVSDGHYAAVMVNFDEDSQIFKSIVSSVHFIDRK